MNLLEAEDIIKGLPDDALMQESEMPTGQLPQFLLVSEIQRRADMRNRYAQQMQERPQGTVADQIKQQGIMSMMPQMGMPQMGMPPQMMSAGGIVKLANGGSTSMPGAGALMGFQAEYIDPLWERATLEARRVGISVEEAYEALKRQAEMNMPNYSMIAPAGMGDMPSLSDVGSAIGSAAYEALDKLPDADAIGRAVGRAASSAQGFIDDLAYQSALQMPNYRALLGPTETRRTPPSVPVDRSFQGITLSETKPKPQVRPASEIYKDSFITQGIDSLLTPERSQEDMAAMFSQDEINRRLSERPGIRSISGFVNIGKALGSSLYDTRNFDMDAYGRDLAGVFESQNPAAPVSENPLTLGGIGERFGSSLYDVFNDRYDPNASNEPSAIGVATDAVAKLGGGDASNKDAALDGKQGGGVNVQGESQRQAQSTSKYGALDDLLAELTGGGGTTDEGLDISDLLADQRRMTQANMLMQLGAGIAGGSVAKGLAAAGEAGMKGATAEQSLALKQRLAKYQAGREDIARADKSKQFYDQLALLEKRYDNELQQSASVGQRELFRTVTALVEAATGEVILPAEQKQALVENLMNKYLNLYAPSFGVTNIPTFNSGIQTGPRDFNSLVVD